MAKLSEKEVLLTASGLRTYERELDELKRVRRQEVAERIKQAIEYGDISENSEYDSAKNEQAFIEQRISDLERMLRHARIIRADAGISVEAVTLGVRVHVRLIDSDQSFSYSIVGSMEANPLEKRISNESPLGKALMNHKIGDIVDVALPAGNAKYEIVDISRSHDDN